jgi:hypothetical protein
VTVPEAREFPFYPFTVVKHLGVPIQGMEALVSTDPNQISVIKWREMFSFSLNNTHIIRWLFFSK